jgi:cytochrome c-type biogenesis protein CcmH
MLKLYIILFLMLLFSIAIIAIPFIKNQLLFSKKFILVVAMVTIFAGLLYQLSGNKPALYQWFTQGKKHYELQTQVEALGGIDGMIDRIQKKLEKNPQDAQGWFILGKLYTIKHDYKAAKILFKKAHELDSNINIPSTK